MALPKLLEDLAFISKLGDYPGSDDNLTTEQFRERFDAAALRIQEYLNNQLLPGLDQLVDVQALLNGILDSTLSLADKAANAKATGDALNRKLDKTGGNVTGNIDMGGKRITNLGTPINAEDVATKGYVDDKCHHFPATIPASAWTVNSNFSSCTITVKGILEDDIPIIDLSLDNVTSVATATDLNDTWGNLLKCKVLSKNSLYFVMTEKPEIDIPIIIKVVR